MAKFQDLSDFKSWKLTLDYEEIIKRNASELASAIKKDAKNQFGADSEYAKDWTQHSKKDKRRSPYSIVYNKEYYQLTHLLEFGHIIKNSKRAGKMRRTLPRPHIQPNVDIQFKKYEADMKKCPIKEG